MVPSDEADRDVAYQVVLEILKVKPGVRLAAVAFYLYGIWPTSYQKQMVFNVMDCHVSINTWKPPKTHKSRLTEK